MAAKSVRPNSRLVTGAQMCGHECLPRTLRASANLNQFANSDSVHLGFGLHLCAQSTSTFVHLLVGMEAAVFPKHVLAHHKK